MEILISFFLVECINCGNWNLVVECYSLVYLLRFRFSDLWIIDKIEKLVQNLVKIGNLGDGMLSHFVEPIWHPCLLSSHWIYSANWIEIICANQQKAIYSNKFYCVYNYTYILCEFTFITHFLKHLCVLK